MSPLKECRWPVGRLPSFQSHTDTVRSLRTNSHDCADSTSVLPMKEHGLVDSPRSMLVATHRTQTTTTLLAGCRSRSDYQSMIRSTSNISMPVTCDQGPLYRSLPYTKSTLQVGQGGELTKLWMSYAEGFGRSENEGILGPDEIINADRFRGTCT